MTKCENSGPACFGSRAYLRSLLIVLIGSAALLVCSCKTTSESTITERRDNLAWDRKVSVTLGTIPSAIVTLQIPMDSLRRLPGGAVFTEKSGHATAAVGIKGDTVVVTALCDSLQTLVAELREELTEAHRYSADQTAKRHPTNRMECFIIGLITGLSIVSIIKLARFFYGKTKR